MELEGKRTKILFVLWNPSSASVKNKLLYAATTHSIKKILQGVTINIQAGKTDELTYEAFIERCEKRL